jgi:hypothetical protein
VRIDLHGHGRLIANFLSLRTGWLQIAELPLPARVATPTVRGAWSRAWKMPLSYISMGGEIQDKQEAKGILSIMASITFWPCGVPNCRGNKTEKQLSRLQKNTETKRNTRPRNIFIGVNYVSKSNILYQTLLAAEHNDFNFCLALSRPTKRPLTLFLKGSILKQKMSF